MNEPCTLVTGAAGFVGRHLCQRLRAAGHRVRGLTRRRDSLLEEMGVEVICGDLNQPAAWQRAMLGADYVIHCAAHAAFGNGPDHHRVNVEGTRHVIAAAQQSGVTLRRFVFVSTIGAVDRAPGDPCTNPLQELSPPYPSSDYGRSKRTAEECVRGSGLPYCIVRPALVVGSDMRHDSHFAAFARMALTKSPVATLAWPGRFSVVHVDDLAAALELSTVHPVAADRTFYCAGEAIALRDFFALVRPTAVRVPLGWAAPLARRLPAAVPFKLKAMLLPALTANDAPLRELGWQPQYSAPAALAEVIARERARRDPTIDPGGQTLITGAASGLGRALVERLSPNRRNLLLVDRDLPGLERVRERHPHCRIVATDLANESGLAALLQGAEWRAHPVREIFACAGMGRRGPVLAHEPAEHARLFHVNVLARLALAQAALPDMIRAQSGRIVFISSSSAFQPLPFMATYAASNTALLFLGEAWAAELEGTGVQLLSVCPGGMRTNFQAAAGVKQLAGERLMAPEAVADAILRALTTQRRTVIISARARGMALAARVLPRAVSVALWKRLMAKLR